MAIRPPVYKPILTSPVAINNYSGKVFKCFTKGDTLPFRFTFKSKDGLPLDMTGCQVWIVMADAPATPDNPAEQQTLLEVEIPLVDLSLAMFEGEVSDSETNSLPSGLIYAQAKYITALGATKIIDMCILEAYPSVTFNTL